PPVRPPHGGNGTLRVSPHPGVSTVVTSPERCKRMRSDALRPANLATLLAASVLVLGLSPRTAPAEDPPSSAVGSATVASFRALDLDGTVHPHPGRARATVLVFLGTECPISNRYVPDLNELARAHAAEGVVVYGVLSSPHTTRAAAFEHRKRFGV